MAHPTFFRGTKQTAAVIFCHGLGDTGHGWLQGFESFALPYVKYICPNAGSQPVTLNMGMTMPAWFDIYSLDKTGPADEAGIKKSSQIIQALIDEEIKNGIPAERIIVGGFSQGGVVALYNTMTNASKLAACIGLSTYMPLHQKFKQICSVTNKSTPIFQAHGTEDPVVNFTFAEMTNKLLNSFYTDVQFKTYKMPHSSCPQEMRDVQEFIKKHLPPV